VDVADTDTHRAHGIAARIVTTGGIALASVAVVAAAAAWAVGRQDDAGRSMAVTSAGMSRQWNADMMHDAWRGDVTAALYARDDATRRAVDVAAVEEHAAEIVANPDLAAAGAPEQLTDDYAQVRAAVVGYGADAIQEMTGRTASAIGRITEVIGQIDRSQAAIAIAVDQQTATAARMTDEVGGMSGAAETITATIADITGSTDTTTRGATRTRDSAQRLTGVADNIRTLIGQFTYAEGMSGSTARVTA
jgi:methyl-accepting chemotaxis protein